MTWVLNKLPQIRLDGSAFNCDARFRLAIVIPKSFLIENCLDRVLIEVDGGIKLHNAKHVLDAGADVLVAGSEVFKSNDPVQTIKDFYKLSNW